MFALKKKIEDSILSAEIFAPTVLEREEVRCIKQQEVIRERNLWDDLSEADEVLVKLAESDKLVDSLKDLRFKVILCFCVFLHLCFSFPLIALSCCCVN